MQRTQRVLLNVRPSPSVSTRCVFTLQSTQFTQIPYTNSTINNNYYHYQTRPLHISSLLLNTIETSATNNNNNNNNNNNGNSNISGSTPSGSNINNNNNMNSNSNNNNNNNNNNNGASALDVAMRVNKLKRLHQTGGGPDGKRRIELDAWGELNSLTEEQINSAEGKAVSLLLNSWAYFAKYWEKGKDGPLSNNNSNSDNNNNSGNAATSASNN